MEAFPRFGDPIMALTFYFLMESTFAARILVAWSWLLCGLSNVRVLDGNFTSFFGEILQALLW